MTPMRPFKEMRPFMVAQSLMAVSTPRKEEPMSRRFISGAVLMLLFSATSSLVMADVGITGELKTWHKVTLTLDGPQASEDGAPNPFMDYRMQVVFLHQETGLTYNIPGYFAADGNAANTSASSGNKWRAHLAPDLVGTWTYAISFRTGEGVAISDDPNAGEAVASCDGLSGSFEIAETDKTGRDLRAKGRLDYVGRHHLQFAGTGEFFLKAGADAPENFLAYAEFDGDFKTDGNKDDLVKTWGPHIQDWRPGDPIWQDGKGKGIIGAVNYLASQGMNVFSFLTLNIEGDDRNVFPYINYDERERIDCSRMDQWEIVFDHGNNLGMYLHFKTQEAENVNLLDDGHLGSQRKLYYRELIARFSHHLALNWNLGEEVGLGHEVSTEKKQAWADYLWTNDPYQHHIVIHNGNNHFDLLGDASALTGFSLQTNQADFSNVHGATLNYIRRSVEAGKPWVVACDEPGDASHSLITDAEDPTHDDARKNALWGNIMAGGAGVEWYFGYQHPHSDLTCQDYRVREKMWTQCRYALEFFDDYDIPFWEMSNANDKLSNNDAYCLCKEGEIYLAFFKKGGDTKLDLSDVEGMFRILWFNPREGGSIYYGSTQAVAGGGKRSLGNPPRDKDQDWLAVVLPADPNQNYAPSVDAGDDQTVMLPKGENEIIVELDGTIHDDGKPGNEISCAWAVTGGTGQSQVYYENSNSANSDITLWWLGTYILTLTASDGDLISQDSMTITIEPFSDRVVRSFAPVEDAFIEGSTTLDNQHLKVEGTRRVAYLKFNVEGLPSRILDVQLQLTEGGDSGGGTLNVYRGSHSDWTGASLQKASAPEAGELLGQRSGPVDGGKTIAIFVANLITDVDGTYTVVLTLDGNDVWFGSSESGSGPKLVITAEEPENGDGKFENVATNSAPMFVSVPPVTNPVTPTASAFAFKYDPTGASKVHVQTDGIVCVEAEDFDFVDREGHRNWYLTTADQTPNVTPDHDPNHSEGAGDGAYLEILPDTRVTHSDPLVNGVSFSNTPGQCSVLYYPVMIETPGRYYVWVRMCCTGAEDNGLHVGLDGEWPESGARMQWTGQHGEWQWDSRQRTEQVHTGVLGQIWLDIEEPGIHTIMFSMREDGFEFDRWMLTPVQDPMPSKNGEMGPDASPVVER
jgi:hypothetical protein